MSERSSGPTASEPIEVDDEPFALTGPGEEETRPTSRKKIIVLCALLAVGLAGAAVTGWTGWRIASQKDATLTAPATVANLTLDESDDGLSTAEYLTTALSADVDLDKTVGGVYRDGSAADRGVLFFGGTALIWTPESDLDTAFGLISDNEGAVTNLHEVPAGDLGGTMKCGTTKTDEGNLAVCGWADHGSLALAMFPNRSEDDSAKLLRDIRNAAQRRN
jgi:hypothetical protein